MGAKELFPTIGKIGFEKKTSKNLMPFHYCYEADKVTLGKPMKDWLKFAMAWWLTLEQAGDKNSTDVGCACTADNCMPS